MYLWSKYKFLILFAIFLVGLPFLVTNISKTLFQEAQTISTDVSLCLAVNPPTVWIEKDLNSRKGYAPSGIKNTELISANLITCGEIEIKQMSFVLEAKDTEDLLNNTDFSLSILGQDFLLTDMKAISKNKLNLTFKFEESIKISVPGSTQKLTLFGTFPGSHFGKTSVSLSEVLLGDLVNSKVSISGVNSSLIFVKKEL
jgi:hypothetical protein